MIQDLLAAQEKADILFREAENRNYIVPGQTEKELNTKIFELAEELFGIRKYWHKRIVRSGENTLLPYKENPPNLIVTGEDILGNLEISIAGTSLVIFRMKKGRGMK